jgi:RNA polymerase sigma factor (sigma-70 family)
MIEMSCFVFVVDGDAALRQALKRLVRSVGLHVELFSSAEEFLQSRRPNVPSCLVLEVKLPGTDGLDLQRQLIEAQIQIPLVFLTAYGDVRMSVRAMKAGAVEFLTKPYRDQDVLDAIQLALARDQSRRKRETIFSSLQERFESLTQREREVVAMAVSGMPNRQIAAQIGITENTVKVHRSRAMTKMQAHSLPDLVKMSEQLETRVKKAS